MPMDWGVAAHLVAEGNDMIIDKNSEAREADDLHGSEYKQTCCNRSLRLCDIYKAQLV